MDEAKKQQQEIIEDLLALRYAVAALVAASPAKETVIEALQRVRLSANLPLARGVDRLLPILEGRASP